LPVLYIFGGANGVGKSTQALSFGHSKNIDVINPDLLKARMPNLDDASFQYFLSSQIEQYFEDHTSFIFESNLHNYESYNLVVDAQRQHRYRTELLYFSTDILEVLIKRVQYRASQGGHDVPVETITERYNESLRLLPEHLRYFDMVELIDVSETLVRNELRIKSRGKPEALDNLPLSNWVFNILQELI